MENHHLWRNGTSKIGVIGLFLSVFSDFEEPICGRNLVKIRGANRTKLRPILW